MEKWIQIGNYPIAKVVDVAKETPKTITLSNGWRRNKETEFDSFHKTKDEAIKKTHAKFSFKIERIEHQLTYTKEEYRKQLKAIEELAL